MEVVVLYSASIFATATILPAGWLLPGVVAPDHAVRKVIDRGADGREDDAWRLSEDLVRASREVYGPPAYHPLDLPGWRI